MADHGAFVEFAPWTVLGESRVELNPFFAYRLDHVRLPGGGELRFAYVDRIGASLIVPVTPDGDIVLIRQYRYTVRETLWEIPAGTLQGEAPEVNARKELKEEVGGLAASLEYVGHFFSSPGAGNDRMHVFLARGVTLGERHLEDTEQIAIVPVPIAEALRMAHAGEITNGPCALALLLCEPLLLREGER
ncbi:MAG: NUDIX hydrolase [Chloroflexi bacterium]|nr:NUDIX hydrolase [Chloroflexota bacterium]